MKILYVADRWDPRDHNQASGTDYEIYHTLLREGADVQIIGPFDVQYSFFERSLMGIHSRIFDTKLFKYPYSYFFKSASHVNRVVEKTEHDLVVSMYAAPLVLARLKKPLLYFCDSTVKWLKEQWRNYAKFTYFTMALWEERVIRKSDYIISFSESNAEALRDEYHVPEDQVDSMAIPASIPHSLVPGVIDEEKDLMPVKLLLVGRDYYRKGIDIAQEVVGELNRRGLNAHLRVVGLDGEDSAHVEFLGFYNKTLSEELEAYLDNYRWANFLIHPARFEAAGIVPSEAAAFGVPTLTNNAGGLATTVEDGVSGVVLPRHSPPEAYVERIFFYVEHPTAYQQLSRSTRERYQRKLHWPAVGERIMDIAKMLADV